MLFCIAKPQRQRFKGELCVKFQMANSVLSNYFFLYLTGESSLNNPPEALWKEVTRSSCQVLFQILGNCHNCSNASVAGAVRRY